MRQANAKHECLLLNRTIYWGECWVVQDIREENTDMEFAPAPFNIEVADEICEKCRWCYVNEQDN